MNRTTSSASSSPQSSPPSRPEQGSSLLTAIGLVAIAGVALALFLLRPGVDASPDGARAHPAVGAPMDDFVLTALGGKEGTVSADEVRGKVVLISFWGTWCGPCVQEFPHLEKIAASLEARDDFVWLPVVCPSPPFVPIDEVRRDVEAFLAARGSSAVTYFDPDGALFTRARAVGASNGGIPLTTLLDRAGKVHAVWNGYGPGVERQVEKAVVDLLGEWPKA